MPKLFSKSGFYSVCQPIRLDNLCTREQSMQNICTREQAIAILKRLPTGSLTGEQFDILKKVINVVFGGSPPSFEELQDYFQGIAGLVKFDNSKTYYEQGVKLFQLGCYKAAVREFSLAIQDNPEFASAYYNRAACLQKMMQQSDVEGLKEIQSGLLKGVPKEITFLDDMKKAANMGNQNAKKWLSEIHHA